MNCNTIMQLTTHQPEGRRMRTFWITTSDELLTTTPHLVGVNFFSSLLLEKHKRIEPENSTLHPSQRWTRAPDTKVHIFKMFIIPCHWSIVTFWSAPLWRKTCMKEKERGSLWMWKGERPGKPFLLSRNIQEWNLIQQGCLRREGRFPVNKHVESLSAVLKGEVINKRKTTTREVENQAQH